MQGNKLIFERPHTDPSDPLAGMVDLQRNNSISGAKWAMTSLNEDTLSLRCMGTAEGPRFLNGLTVEGKVALAPVTSGVFTGTHWSAAPGHSDANAIELNCAGAALGDTVLAEKNGDVVLAARFAPAPPNALWRVHLLGKLSMLQCMGTAPGVAHRFLNGRTRDTPPTVDLQDLTSGPNTGTLWLTAFADQGSGAVTISCQGVLGGPRFLNGQIGDGTVGLVDSPDDSSGTKWFIARHPLAPDDHFCSIGLGGAQRGAIFKWHDIFWRGGPCARDRWYLYRNDVAYDLAVHLVGALSIQTDLRTGGRSQCRKAGAIDGISGPCRPRCSSDQEHQAGVGRVGNRPWSELQRPRR